MPTLAEAKMLDIEEIMKVLPHRYPFLLVDRILELEPGKKAVALKNVSVNEPQFTGHFPGRPIMPGVLIVEALAQVAGIALLRMEEYHGKLALIVGIDGMRFRRQVRPGDQLILSAELLKAKAAIGRVRVEAKVDNQVVADGELLFSLVD